MKVRFVTDAFVQENGVAKKLFDAGAEIDLNDASAERWRRRGVAVPLEDASRDPSLPTVLKAAEHEPTPPAESAAPEPVTGKAKKAKG